MRKIGLIAISISLLPCFFNSCNPFDTAPSVQKIQVTAPFDMPVISIPDFSNCKTFSIMDYGAIQSNKEKNQMAISAAIAEANEAGGGTVSIPAGEWLTGKIHLKSNVNLRIEEGATLLFSDEPDDYLPVVRSSWEGVECYNYSPLIYAYECKNVAITGKGEIRAEMDLWEQWFEQTPAHMEGLKRLYYYIVDDIPVEERVMTTDSSHFRPHFIQFNRCENVLMEGISIRNSPFWTIHVLLSRDIVLRDLNVMAHGFNSDGVDPEMSQNMLIEHCVFDQGDDAVAIKSGRNQEAWRLDTPSKNIVIKNCTVKNAHQLVAIGSELSGGVENVFVDSCTVLDGAFLYHLLYIKTNERRGGFVKNIHMKNITAGHIDKGILGIETDVLYQWRDMVPTIERRLTPIQGLFLENVTAKDVKFVARLIGQEELPVQQVYLKNVQVDTILHDRIMNENVVDFKEENLQK